MTKEIKQTNNPKQVIEWAQTRGVTVLVNLPGSGGGFVQVDKKDFIRQISLLVNPLRDTELDATYYFEPIRKNLYAA